MKRYAPIVLRLGLSLVMLWFGSQQLLNAPFWLGFLPEWTKVLPVSPTTLIYLNGWFEVTFGLLLLAGFYLRPVALLLTLHLLNIVLTVGYNAIGVRDFGLTLGMLSVFLHGRDAWSLDSWYDKASKLSAAV